MQRRSDAARQAVTKLNKQDMAENLQKIKEVNRRLGNPGDVINIAMNGRYNSTTFASRKKPGQNTSQAIAIACEMMTEKKYIIAAAIQNKLCWTVAWLRGKGMEVECAGGHPDCTANTYR